MEKQDIRDLVDMHADGTALEQAFYTDADIYEREISEIYLKSWLYAGHCSEIPKVGDWFLFEMGGNPSLSCVVMTTKSALCSMCVATGGQGFVLKQKAARKCLFVAIMAGHMIWMGNCVTLPI